MIKEIEKLKLRLLEISNIKSALNLISWDELVYMPQRAGIARARQKATLARLAHEKFVSSSIGRMIDRLHLMAETLPYDDDDSGLIRVIKREYDRAVKVPSHFVAMFEKHRSASYEAWCKAREENNFSIIVPYLERSLEMSREFADFFPGYKHIADPLIDNEDYGMRVCILQPIFSQLRKELISIVRNISNQTSPDDNFLYEYYPQKDQLEFGRSVIELIGYDFMRGRQDLSQHPFTTCISLDDVRITTRVNEYDFFESFSSTLHEAGHAFYVQGISQKYDGTPLAKVPSMGITESLARLWENPIGRSKMFWRFFFPKLYSMFPNQLQGVTIDSFYNAINKVKPSLIRTEADEVTYNLHVIIRFELELELLEGTLKVKDLPDAWNSRYASDLGICPSNCSEGVLQDVHWYCDLIGGGFQCYSIGNILSAIILESALKANNNISQEIETGNFSTLQSWLNKYIYQHGCKYTTSELIERIGYGSLTIEPYIQYLKSKYGSIYKV